MENMEQPKSQRSQCRICLKTVTNTNLKRHEDIHSGKSRKSCKICGKTVARDGLKGHLETHNKNRPKINCDLCGVPFGSKSGLRNHIKYFHNKEQGTLLCAFCPAKFSYMRHLEIHTRKHTLERPYFCDLCQSEFVTKYCLKLHKNVHTKEHSYKCYFCPKLMFHKNGWRRHIQTHTREKYFKCEICSMSLATLSDLKRHVNTAHFGIKKFKCGICAKLFSTNGDLRRHTGVHLGLKVKCKVCNKVLTKGSYPEHSKIHKERDRNHKCGKCTATFKSKGCLYKHNRSVHNKQISHRISCVLCPLKFRCLEALEIHTRSHTLERPFFCNQCGQELTTKAKLKLHKEMHNPNRLRRFQCEICPKSFTYKENLKRHVLTHTANKSVGLRNLT